MSAEPGGSIADIYEGVYPGSEARDLLLVVLQRRRPKDVETFARVLYDDIDQAIEAIEGDAHLVSGDSEDSLTSRIVMFLKARGYRATANPFVRGHVDVVVESNDERFKWLGEAKCFTGDYVHLNEGFLQLQTRYMSGRHPHAGLLIYVKVPNCRHVMEEWRGRIGGAAKDTLPDHRELVFRTIHENPSSGLDVTIRHMPTVLDFAPKDKSARKSKSRKDAADAAEEASSAAGVDSVGSPARAAGDR